MAHPDSPPVIRFDRFSVDRRTLELKQDGRLIRLQDQPVRLLILLADRAGELVTRDDIQRALWGEDQFVDVDHGINTAMRKIRDALEDAPDQPRFIETLPRKGYRFIGTIIATSGPLTPSEPVPYAGKLVANETVPGGSADSAAAPDPSLEIIGLGAGWEPRSAPAASQPPGPQLRETVSGDMLPVKASSSPPAPARFAIDRGVARLLFLAIQAGYLTMYCVFLFQSEAGVPVLGRFLLVRSPAVMPVLLAYAMCGIALRLYLITSVGLSHPEAGRKFRQLFPAVFLFDAVWAASPLLLADEIGTGLALASVAALAYLPFSARTLMESIYREEFRASS